MSSPNQSSGPSLAYQTGLCLVSVGMVALPLAYLALTTLTCWSVYYFATQGFPAIWSWPAGHSYYGLMLKVVASCTPLLVGGAIAIAMVKPLFNRAHRPHPLALDPQIEPRVHALIQQVCEIVGAPQPRRIELNCDLNAGAAFDGGWRGLFTGRLVLSLGLPLVAGLTERQLAGVLAHEFGHFRQAVGMRLTYIVRQVNYWFARVIYERDGWDDSLESWREGSNGWVTFMITCTQAGVGFSRGVLWILMKAGHGLSGFLLRQMEFDADRWEMHVAGSAGFESTMLRHEVLSSVLDDIRREMRRVWRRQLQLPDNLPLLVQHRLASFPAEKMAKIERAAGQSKTGWFDTHPSAADRIRQARSLNVPGIVQSEAPASDLFEHFVTGSRLVTLAFYEDDLNVPTGDDFLIPLEAMITGTVNPSAPPPPKTAPAPVPMMNYDPSRFRQPATPENPPEAGQ